jgi:Spy/CpxP family protein refolding chaperone
MPSFVPLKADSPNHPSDAMKMKLILCSLAALLWFGLSASAAPDPNFHIYLCFGQSNMESGGKMDEMDKTVDQRFQVMADFEPGLEERTLV